MKSISLQCICNCVQLVQREVSVISHKHFGRLRLFWNQSLMAIMQADGGGHRQTEANNVRRGHCARRTFVRGGHSSRRTLSAAYIVRMTSCGGHSPRRTFSGAVRGGLSANPRRIRQSPRRIRSDPRGLADSAAESAADFFVRLGHRPRRTVGRTYADIRGHRRIRLSTRRIRGGQSPPHIVPFI